MKSFFYSVLAAFSAFTFFATAMVVTLHLWSPITCAPTEDGLCEFDEVLGFLGVALGIFVHGLVVAVFSWTPISQALRCRSNETESPFGTFLAASMLCDVLSLLTAVYIAIPGLIDTTMCLQVAVIAFNIPIAVLVPYLLAAYRDRYTLIGGFLHMIRERMAEGQLELPTSAESPLFEYPDYVAEKQTPAWARS